MDEHAAGPAEANGAEANEQQDDVQQSEEQQEGGAQQQPLSKSQQKKLLKQQRYAEQKQLRREREKAARQAKQEQRRAEGKERIAEMTEEQRAAYRAERQAKVDARKAEGEAKKAKLRQGLESGQRIVVDLDFEGLMTDTELRSLCQQLGYAYGENSRAEHPAHLIFTSIKGEIKEYIEKQLTGFGNWVATKTEQDYLQHFEGQADQLVYLTADSTNEITELDPSKAYIIGGLVDRNRHKGICLRRAEEQGIASGRLPIGEYLSLASSQVMTTNHVVEIMLRWLELRDWEAAFNAVVPPRKRKQSEEEGGEPTGDAAQQAQKKQRQEAGAKEPPAGAAPATAAAGEATEGAAAAGDSGPDQAAAQDS